jgi:hypothetical protein
VFMLSKAFWAFSYASLNFFSTSFISGSSTKSIQICMLSSHNFLHSSSTFLMLAMISFFIISLPTRSFGGVPDVLHNCRSSIFDQNPLMNLPIFNIFSSIVASTIIGASGISMYNFWKIIFMQCTILSVSSFSFISLSTFPSDSLFSFKMISTFYSTALFSWREIVYSFCSYVFSSTTFIHSRDAVS